MALDPLLAEIDDDLRRENMRNLWRAMGSYIITVTGLILIGTIAIVGWQKYQDNKAQTLTLQLLEARHEMDNGRTAEAVSHLQQVIDAQHKTLSPLATLWAAQIKNRDSASEAVTTLKPLLDAPAGDDAYLHFSHLLAGHDNTASERFTGPFVITEREILALSLLKQGKKAEAAQQFQQILDEAGAPETAQARARLMLSTELANAAQAAQPDGKTP